MKKQITTYFMAALALLMLSISAAFSQSLSMKGEDNKKGTERSVAPVHRTGGSSSVFAPSLLNNDDGTVLHGSVVSCSIWSSWEPKYGIYSIEAKPETLFSAVNLNNALNSAVTGVYVDGNYHFISVIEIIISHIDGSHSTRLMEVIYNVYDAGTWEPVKSVQKEVNYKNTAIALTYDSLTDNVYAITYGEDKTGYYLSTMNTETGDIKQIAPIEMLYYTLSASPDGKLYAIASDGNLYTLDKNTARPTLVGATGVKPAYAQSATFDHETGKLYWAAYISEGNSALYEVNTQTGKATLINRFPYGEQVVGLFVKSPLAESNAPAVANNLIIETDTPGGLAGTVSFNAPTQTFGGTNLSGELTYKVKVDDAFVKTGTCTPGEKVAVEHNFTEGLRTVFITTENTAGRSPRVATTHYFGNDIPLAVKDLNFSISDTGMASLSWNMPNETTYGGYLDEASLTYRVVRNTDGTVVADNLTTTNFSEQLPDNMASYSYTVTVYSHGREGGSAVSESKPYGSSVGIPYFNSFDDAASMNLLTVLDLDENEEKWYYVGQQQNVQCWFWDTADDWLITPALNLGITNVYKLSFSVKTGFNVEKLRITLGTSIDPDDHTTVLADMNELFHQGTAESYTFSFSVSSSGLCHIGFHYYSDDGFYIELDNIALTEGAAIQGPDVVKDMVVTAAGEGALAADISFKAPLKDITGSNLTALTKILIYRNEVEAKEFTSPSPGAELSWTDNNAIQGMNTYKVIAYSEEGIGDVTEASVYVGEDTPNAVQNLLVNTPDDKKAVLSWGAPSGGANGYHLSIDKLSYIVSRFNRTKQIYEEVEGGANIPSLSFTDSSLSAFESQDLVEYTVTANSVAGSSEVARCNVIIGDPYRLPFNESFSNQLLSSDPWINEVITGQYGWMMTGDPINIGAQDNDKGILTFMNQSWAPAECLLISPKIKIGEAGYPILSFWMYHFDEEVSAYYILDILISADYAPFEALGESIPVFNEIGWKEYLLPLSDYKQANSIRIALKATAPSYEYPIFLDNFTIEHQLEDDLMLSNFRIPSKLNEGEEGEFVVSVMNKGRNNASGYRVELYKDDLMVTSANGMALNSREFADINILFTLPISEAGNECSFYAKVVYDSDMDTDNNVSSIYSTFFVKPLYPAIDDLAGETDNVTNELQWSAPIATSAPLIITEDFESYTSFIIDNIGEWKVYDEDGQTEFSIEWYDEYENAYGPSAWQVWAPAEVPWLLEETTGWEAYSGEKCLISWGASGYMPEDMEPTQYPKNNDWLISPQIVGGSVLSFMTKAAWEGERFEVWVSSTDDNIDSFMLLSSEELNTTQWTEFIYELPLNAKHFAIRYVSTYVFALLLDDISYVPADSNTDIQLEGYNVYRNKEKINNSIVTSNSFSEAAVSADYAVTTVWDKGESAFSNVINLTITAIDLPESDILVYGKSKAIVIEGAEGMNLAVYSLNGQQIHSAVADHQTIVPVNQGIYIVKLDGESKKVIVQ